MNRAYYINFDAPSGPPVEVIQGENKATTISVGVQSVVQQWPDATFVVILKRSDGATYIGAADLVPADGKSVAYLLTNTDTELRGLLRAQINAMQGEVVVKSCILDIRVNPSLDDAGPAPEPGQGFVDKVLEAAQSAEDARDDAQAAASQVKSMTFDIDDNGHLIREMQGADPTDIGRVVGDIGPTPVITAGPVTPLPAGEAPTVTITGTPEEPVMNFGIPYGPPADLDEVASRWSFYADGNPVSVYPSAESSILVTADRACTLTYPGGTVALVANTPSEIPAGAGENVLTADSGAVLSVGYNRDSMNLLTSTAAPISGMGTVAQVDGAIDGLPMDVTARLIATQEGLGDPSPDNIRPIVGTDTLNVTRTGKNLFKPGKSSSAGGITFDFNSDGSITLNGTATNNPSRIEILLDTPIPSGMYTLSANNPVENYNVTVRLYDKEILGGAAMLNLRCDIPFTKYSRELPSPINSFRIAVAIGTTVENFTIKPQLELGPTATPYEPYAGNTYPIALPETMFGLPGAPVTVRNDGSGAKPTNLITFDGTESFGTGISSDLRYFSRSLTSSQLGVNNAVSSSFKNVLSSTRIDNSFYIINAGSQLVIFYNHVNTVDEFKAYLAAQYAAGTPVQVLYELATPQSFTVAPFDVPALEWENNVWSDGGGETDISTYQGLKGYKAANDAQLAYMQAQIIALQNAATNP